MISPLRRALDSMNSIHATMLPNGKVALKGKETYYKRARIRELGVFWNAEEKHWTVPSIREALLVNAIFMVRVTVDANCHMPIRVIWASHVEVISGVVRLGCPKCDTSFQCGDDVKILCIVDTQLYNTILAYELSLEEEMLRIELEDEENNSNY